MPEQNSAAEGALRAVVREVLRELLPVNGGGVPPAQQRLAAGRVPTPGVARVEEVRIGSDAELAAFVARLVALCEEEAGRAALREGRHRFRLARPAGQGAAPGPARRVEKCVLSETRLVELGCAGGELVLDKGVVVTPLARDKARELGIRLTRSE